MIWEKVVETFRQRAYLEHSSNAEWWQPSMTGFERESSGGEIKGLDSELLTDRNGSSVNLQCLRHSRCSINGRWLSNKVT